MWWVRASPDSLCTGRVFQVWRFGQVQLLEKIGDEMNRPKLPKNESYWIHMAKSEEYTKAVGERGNDKQKKALRMAQKYLKWKAIQERKMAVLV